jgi:hypothetical protein
MNGAWELTVVYKAISKNFADSAFEPGELRITQRTLALHVDYEAYLRRHLSGDWGRVRAEVQAANDQAVETGHGAIGSAYETPAGWLFMITRSDRSATTLLRPSDVEAYM